jgi:hypothetical protein
MLMMHLSLEVAQHWHLIVQWLYVSSVIDKAQMLAWADLGAMKLWMQQDWSTRSPAQLFAKAAKGDKDVMIKRRAAMEGWDGKGTWLQHLLLSSKTAFIIQYVPSITTTSYSDQLLARRAKLALLQNRKIAIFGRHLRAFAVLTQQLRHHVGDASILDVLKISGRLAPGLRHVLLTSFQHSRLPGVLLLSSNSCSVSLNIQQVSEVIFLESGWNPAQDRQAMCRAWRIGQTSKVLVTHLLLRGTIDSHIKEAIKQRNRLADEFDRSLRDKAADAPDHHLHFLPTVWEKQSTSWEEAGAKPQARFFHELQQLGQQLAIRGPDELFYQS